MTSGYVSFASDCGAGDTTQICIVVFRVECCYLKDSFARFVGDLVWDANLAAVASFAGLRRVFYAQERPFCHMGAEHSKCSTGPKIAVIILFCTPTLLPDGGNP